MGFIGRKEGLQVITSPPHLLVEKDHSGCNSENMLAEASFKTKQKYKQTNKKNTQENGSSEKNGNDWLNWVNVNYKQPTYIYSINKPARELGLQIMILRVYSYWCLGRNICSASDRTRFCHV